MRDEFILIYSRSGSWGTRCLSPATVRPFAAGGPRVWGHSRFSPAAFGPAGVSPLRGEVRPQKRFCPLQMCSPRSKPSQPPLGAWRAGRVHPHLFSVWQLRGRIVFPLLQSVLSPPAGRVCGDTVDSPLQRSDPVLATCQSSTSHSINPDKDAKGSPSWRRVPLLTIRSGYTFQFGEYPPRLDGVSTDDSKQRLQGFCSTAVAFLPPTERSDRGYTAVGHRTRVLQLKGYGGLRPILDLRRLNFSLYKGKFKMLTMRTIMSQVQEGDWFVTIDLKDAYFHIQVILRHRRFRRFAFGGKAYQYKILPFGLALVPRTFTKCMDAALAPLRLQGIRVLNYLDDWLILAHSRELVSCHRDIVLGHIHSLGLRMNAKKSVLLPSQRTVFLGVRLDSVQMQARLAPARIPVLTACLAHFKLGHHVSVGTCRRLLGLMAAASPVLPLGLLHMRPFLWWMRELRLHPTVPATRLIRVSRSCCQHLLMWKDPVFLRDQSGVRMGAIHRRHMITTDASMTGWGAVFEGRPASGEWKEKFLFWHINCLELRAVFLALKYFLPVLGGYHIIVRTDNMAVVSHINRQGGSRPSSPLVPRQVPLFEGGSRSGSTEPGGRFSVETEVASLIPGV